MPRPRRSLTLPLALVALVALVVPGGASAQAGPAPSIRLLTADPSFTLVRYGHRAWLDAGVYVAAAGGALEIRVQRPDYDHPFEAIQHVDGGAGVALPSSAVRGLVGLRRFVHVTITDPRGEVTLDRYHPFCPASEVRVNDDGPLDPTYAGYCFGSPFTLGTIWGIDEGWATNATAYAGDPIKGPDGVYTVSVAIADRYVELLGIAPGDATATVRVKVRTAHGGGGGGGCPPICEGDGPHHPHRTAIDDARSVPTLPEPAADVVPDLVALPAWSILVEHRRRGDFLDFGATVWNAGPAPMLVEGFRRPGEPMMDAFQYFTDASGRVVGKAAAGDMMWDARRGHQHWHFMQFARYALLDADRTTTIVSRKEAFCLAPTDAIDLLVPRADLNPGALGLGGSNCGSGPSALWVREVLQTGWGDTYFQGLPGQSFDITDLPNGTYYIAVEANPLGLLHETRTDNNLELREVILGGRPGHRTVTVPPWHGIDTEGMGGGGGGVVTPVP